MDAVMFHAVIGVGLLYLILSLWVFQNLYKKSKICAVLRFFLCASANDK